MGFKELDQSEWAKRSSRVLLIGGPNTRKTFSVCASWDRPVHIVSFPGEQGAATIPLVEGVKAYVWEDEDPSAVKLDTTIREVENLTWEVLTGKRGEIKTFAGDGLVKLAACYWRRQFQKLLIENEQGLASGRITEEECKIRAYGNENYGACRDILQYVNRVCNSNVENVVFTTWEGREIDDPDAQRKTSHIFADLPGKLARQIVGEFSVVLRSDVGLPGPDGKSRGTWQVRPKGKVWGVGIKGPVEVVSKIPDDIPQDWQLLKKALHGGEVKWR